MKRRWRSALPRLTAGVLGCLLAGCGAPSSGIVLRLATTQAGEQMREPFRQALSHFETAHPGVRVQLQEMSDEVYQQMGLVTLFAGGTPPDVYFQWGGYGVRRYAAAGYALDLTQQFSPEERARYYPACWTSATATDGHVYLWPDASSITTVFWYRTPLFRRLGLRAPQSWDDLLRAGDRLREAGVIPLAVGNRALWPGANLAAYLCAQQAGVDGYNAVLGLKPGTRLDDPAFVAAFTRLSELRERGLLNRGVDGTGTDEARSLLSQGKAGMHPIGDWLATEADASDAADLDAFRLPRLPEQRGKNGMLLALTTGYMVYRKSAHPELAVALLRSLTRDDVQQDWARHGHLSAVRAAAPGSDAAPGMRRLVSFLNTAPEGAIAPDVGFNPEVADAFMDAAALVLGGRATPAAALADAERQVSALREGLNRQDAKSAKNSEKYGGVGSVGVWGKPLPTPIRPHPHTPKPLRVSVSPCLRVSVVKSLANLASKRIRKEERALAWLGVPAMALYLLFVVGPVLAAGALSLFRWDGVAAAQFFGVGNYVRALFADPIFARSFLNNTVYVLITVVVEVGFGLLFAAALQARLPLASFWRALFFSPMILPMVVVGLLWGFVLNPEFGLLNAALRGAGLQRWERAWLGEEATALTAVSLVSGWRYAGFYMALFAAGLRRIPSEVLEAARLDGASEITLFRAITLPLLAPVTAVALLLCVTGGFQAFDLFYVMTNGGPMHGTEIPALWMVKKAFNRQSLGYGSALGVLLTLVVVAVGAVQMRLRKDERA